MYVRSVKSVAGSERDIDWGNGKSYRLLIAADNMGFAVCHTTVRAATESLLQYRAHLEACYCIAGEGEVEDSQGNIYPSVRATSMYWISTISTICAADGQKI